jgi:AcrR family transcriptional regulator
MVRADTRQRILDVSAVLFVEQGYDGTSLREIAEALGVTKAALYYHFASKDQILRALLEPADELITGLLERLEAAGDRRAWGEALEWVVSEVFTNRDLFRLIGRNRQAAGPIIDAFADDLRPAELFERVEKAAAAAAASLGEQVRMVAALSAVTGFDDWAPTLLQEAPPQLLADELVATTRRILGLPEPEPTAGPRC